jgi:hypothetical protein
MLIVISARLISRNVQLFVIYRLTSSSLYFCLFNSSPVEMQGICEVMGVRIDSISFAYQTPQIKFLYRIMFWGVGT